MPVLGTFSFLSAVALVLKLFSLEIWLPECETHNGPPSLTFIPLGVVTTRHIITCSDKFTILHILAVTD